MVILYLTISLLAFMLSYVCAWNHDPVFMGMNFVTSCVAWKLAEMRIKSRPL